MRMSNLLIPTLREVPAEAEIISHKLMLRAGLIRKTAAGLYSYLPLAYRVIKKVEGIIREELDRKGGQELLMPALQPAELWQESGRWNAYGPEMVRLTDRHKRQFCLGPTHEEVITDLVKKNVKSYKQLPLLLYQIQSKYRDEIRPRFGLMRSREFIMKDLYSFSASQECLDECYEKMYDAYSRIFARCGLQYRAVEADSGAIGGNSSHEFMVIADSGEDEVLYCTSCDYAANEERAETYYAGQKQAAEPQEIIKKSTPGIKTIDDLANFLSCSPKLLIKTLFYQVTYDDKEELVAVLIRGDRTANEVKIKNLLNSLEAELADQEKVAADLNLPIGFIGPIGLPQDIRVLADREVMDLTDAVAGANEPDYHLLHVSPGRDFKPDFIADLKLAAAGDLCPRCQAPLAATRGIEVGHVFKLGTKYSKALGANFLDENGKSQPMIMGCYGIGVGRTVAAAIEQNHDANGIIWPMPLAPYHVIIIPVSIKDDQQRELAETLYADCLAAGVEVLFDDRKERPGVKFKDADLIGIPLKVVIGPKAIEEKTVEIKCRKTGEEIKVPFAEALTALQDRIKKEMI
ncbi:MAG: proline--tRNA ligase [bacterium]